MPSCMHAHDDSHASPFTNVMIEQSLGGGVNNVYKIRDVLRSILVLESLLHFFMAFNITHHLESRNAVVPPQKHIPFSICQKNIIK